jgi:RNA polymerase sigma factor (sigma-70 family)
MNNNAVAEIFAEYRERLLKFIRSRIGVLEDAEDILQDVFYQLARVDSLAKPMEPADALFPMAAWLYRVARNKIIDHHKKKKNEPLPVWYDENGDDYIFEDIADIVYGAETTPETEHLRKAILEEIKAALDELPEEQRMVFELTEIAGFSVKEVAKKTGTPLNTVLSRKYYAVKRLREGLAELYSDVMGAQY